MKKYNYSKLSQRDLEASSSVSSAAVSSSNGSTVIDTGMYLRDWRQALRTPPSYRIGNRTIRLQVHIIWPLVVLGSILLFLLYVIGSSTMMTSGPTRIGSMDKNSVIFYNSTYPLTAPIVSNGIYSFRIGVIADLDTNSRVGGKDSWNSYFMKGYLSYIPSKGTVTVSWDETGPKEIKSSFC